MVSDGIVVVLSGFPRVSETFALNEVLALASSGTLATAFATKPGDGFPSHPDAKRIAGRVHYLPAGGAQVQTEALVEHLAGRRVAGVHGYFAHRPAEIARAAAAKLGVPFSFSVHARDARKVTRSELAERAREAAGVIACNSDVAEEVGHVGGAIRVIPHGVDLHRFRPSYAVRGGPLRVLAVGRLVEKKGFDVLLQAVLRLSQPWRLRIVGEGPERPRLEALASEAPPGSVALPGAVTHDELPEHYTWADVVVVPSVADASGDRDGLPNVLLEAMASSRMVVASDVGAIASAVLPGRTGVLVPPGDATALAEALAEASERPEWRRQLGTRARREIEHEFELGRCGELFRRALEEIHG